MRPRLIPLALTALMVCSVLLTSPAAASSAAGKRRSSDHTVGKPQLNRAPTRLVLSPARATVRAGARQYYHAEGYNAAGHDLGDLTAQTSFSIHPDGSCAGASCTATKPGLHTITGTVHQGHRAISAMAALEVVAPPSPVEPSRRPVSPSRGPVDASRRPVSPSRGPDPPSRRPVEPGRGPVEPPRDPAASPRHQAGRPQPLALLELEPARAFISPGERLTYTAWLTTPDRSPLNVTDQTTFSIQFSAAKTNRHIRPDGSCTANTCTATKLGRHTVTGTLDLGDSIISGTAALQVVPRHHGVGRSHHQVYRELRLVPATATIRLGDGQAYHALADGDDVTAKTSFTFRRNDGGVSGACPNAICNPPKVGDYIVTGVFPQPDGFTLTATATLLVVPGDLASLELHPASAVIKSGGKVTYTVHGLDKSGTHLDQLGDLAPFTGFKIDPKGGSCTDHTCTATSPRQYRVTATLDLSDRNVTGKASLRVTTTPPNCMPSARDVRDLRVTPSKGQPGTQVQITAKIDQKFSHCPQRIFLDGPGSGVDATVGPDGSISVRRSVPNDAKPGITTVRLATVDGRTLAQASFRIIPKPRPNWLRWLLFALGALLLLVLAVLAILGERERRQRRWARHHIRAEPHPSSDDATVDQDPQSAPTFSVRLQPHGDAGSQTLEEGD